MRDGFWEGSIVGCSEKSANQSARDNHAPATDSSQETLEAAIVRSPTIFKIRPPDSIAGQC
jgi:hypothetical protein